MANPVNRFDLLLFFEDMLKAAQHNLERSREFVPVLVEIDNKMRPEFTAVIFKSQAEKDVGFRALNLRLRQKYKSGKLAATLFIGDVFYREMTSGEASAYIGAGHRPFTDPQASEALLATLRTPGKRRTVKLPYRREAGQVVWGTRVDEEPEESYGENDILDWSKQ